MLYLLEQQANSASGCAGRGRPTISSPAITRGFVRHPGVARAYRRTRRTTRPSDDRHRNRSWPLGLGVGSIRLSGVGDQPDGSRSLPRPPPCFGREIRCRRRQATRYSVRTDRHNHREIAGDTPDAEAIKVLARTHQSLIWARTRHANMLRSGSGSTTPPPSKPSTRSPPRCVGRVRTRTHSRTGRPIEPVEDHLSTQSCRTTTQHRDTRPPRSKRSCAANTSPHPLRWRRLATTRSTTNTMPGRNAHPQRTWDV